jgi:RNase H-like domain found in reverse transcriptase
MWGTEGPTRTPTPANPVGIPGGFRYPWQSLLTTKECAKNFPPWTEKYQTAFDKIKQIVVSRECLTVIDHDKLATHKIFVTTDASDRCTGAVLSFGTTWETARPVTFDSSTLKDAELNYPVHEKELLAIIRAIKK